LRAPSLARVMRGNEKIADVEVTGLKRGPNDARDDIAEGEMCGMSVKTTSRLDLQEGDHIELYTREEVQRLNHLSRIILSKIRQPTGRQLSEDAWRSWRLSLLLDWRPGGVWPWAITISD
jgi:hypothetical protein